MSHTGVRSVEIPFAAFSSKSLLKVISFVLSGVSLKYSFRIPYACRVGNNSMLMHRTLSVRMFVRSVQNATNRLGGLNLHFITRQRLFYCILQIMFRW